MANRITYNRRPDVSSLRMSNDATEVLWDILRAAGRALDVPVSGDGLLGWMLDRDQEEYGRGCVGFDLDDMPWGDVTSVALRRATLLGVVDRAATGADWGQLDYTPGPMMPGRIADFRALIAAYAPPTPVPEEATP